MKNINTNQSSEMSNNNHISNEQNNTTKDCTINPGN